MPLLFFASAFAQQRPEIFQGLDATLYRPATRPAGSLHAQISKAFAELTDDDAKVRQAAKKTLMELAPKDLSSLTKVVRQSMPLAPAQANELREIVFHARCAVEPYTVTTQEGFLGVRLGEIMVRSEAEQPDEKGMDPIKPDPNQLPIPVRPRLPVDVDNLDTGVLIVFRIPGFVGERVFEDGDIIVGAAAHPRVIPIRNTTALKTYVQYEVGAGKPAEFLVIRQGQIVNVSVTPDVKPDPDINDGPEPLRTLREDRLKKAEQYWREVFEPMLKDGVG